MRKVSAALFDPEFPLGGLAPLLSERAVVFVLLVAGEDLLDELEAGEEALPDDEPAEGDGGEDDAEGHAEGEAEDEGVVDRVRPQGIRDEGHFLKSFFTEDSLFFF